MQTRHTPVASTVNHTNFLENLKNRLQQPYSHTLVAGHDTYHVRRMELLGPKIATFLDFDMDEYVAAVWLHNLDRAPASVLPNIGTSFYEQAMGYLADSNFDAEAKERIAITAATHQKRDDEPGDSTLLTAVRIADKCDRMGPIGIMTSSMIYGYQLPIHPGDKPVALTNTALSKMQTIYDDFFRILEWVNMLPSDKAREVMIDPVALRSFIDFVRALAQEISVRFGVENHSEQDIKRALGKFYDTYAI